ncbi:MAG: glycosyltransferase family 39 protein, partial [Planctomycetota bacterium]
MDETTRPPRGAGRALPPALGVVVVAAALRALYAARKSLVLDEFHSLHHATHAPLDAFFTDLVRDNHPPLSFLVIGASAEAFGTSELALRLPALVAGVLEIALVHRLVRTVGGARAAALGAAALLATSTMPFDYGTQARMYALFSTAITCVVLCLVALVRSETVSRSAQVGLALAAAAAFHLHYFTAQYLLVLVPVAAGAAAVAGGAPRAVRLVPPLVAAAALITPWTLFGVREQLGHGLPPGGDDLGPRALFEAFVHLFSHNVSPAGEVARWAFVATAGVGLGLAALGARALLRDPATRSAGAIVAACAFAVPVAAFALALVLPRAGFTWHYVLGSA